MRTGRPKADNPKNLNVTVRFDAQTFEELTAYCKKHDVSKAEATRESVKQMLDKEKEEADV